MSKDLFKSVLFLPLFGRTYMYLRLLNAARQDAKIRDAVFGRRFDAGYCPICEKKSLFVRRGEWLRDEYFCVGCFSIPRQRAIIHVLETYFPNWRKLNIHESSSGGQSSVKLASECPQYSNSQYYPDVTPGSTKDGIRSENLEKLTFPDGSFDLFITQDVFEHVLHPDAAFREVARVLKKGGSHVFTVPYYADKRTVVRATEGQGGIEYLESAEYHGTAEEGAAWLVVTDWGSNIVEYIEKNTEMRTQIFGDANVYRGIEGEFLEVFVSRKNI